MQPFRAESDLLLVGGVLSAAEPETHALDGVVESPPDEDDGSEAKDDRSNAHGLPRGRTRCAQCAIANKPDHVSIRPDGDTLGQSGARPSARATSRVQVHLAGFAAERVLTKRRSRQIDQEIGSRSSRASILPPLVFRDQGKLAHQFHTAGRKKALPQPFWGLLQAFEAGCRKFESYRACK